MRRWDLDEEVDETPTPTPAFQLLGYRHLQTGVLQSARFVQHIPDQSEYEPVYSGGPHVVADVLAAAIALAEDRSESLETSRDAFLWHKLQMQIALGKFVAAGGQLP